MSNSNMSFVDNLMMDPKILANKAITGSLIWLLLDYGNLTNYVVSPLDSSIVSALKIGGYTALSDSLGASLRKAVPQLNFF